MTMMMMMVEVVESDGIICLVRSSFYVFLVLLLIYKRIQTAMTSCVMLE